MYRSVSQPAAVLTAVLMMMYYCSVSEGGKNKLEKKYTQLENVICFREGDIALTYS